jgi:hypothetical protein
MLDTLEALDVNDNEDGDRTIVRGAIAGGPRNNEDRGRVNLDANKAFFKSTKKYTAGTTWTFDSDDFSSGVGDAEVDSSSGTAAAAALDGFILDFVSETGATVVDKKVEVLSSTENSAGTGVCCAIATSIDHSGVGAQAEVVRNANNRVDDDFLDELEEIAGDGG